MKFAQPLFLHGIWLGLGLMIGYFVYQSWQERCWKKYFSKDNWTRLTDPISKGKRLTRSTFYYLSFALLCAALARPQLGSSLQNSKSLGVELIIAVDVSESMLAEDNKPSRLVFAKSEISRLIDRLGGDRVGLIAFAGSAFLVSPITSDKSALKMFLDGMSTTSVSLQGTNVREALKVAAEAFERGGVEGEDGLQKPTRVILLASDGEDHEEGALAVARDLARQGVRIFSWGFGTEKGAPIPQRDEFGNLKGYKKDRSGQVIMSTATDKFLKSVADAGGGKYVHAFFGGNGPDVLEKALNQMEKAEFESASTVVYDEKFQIPLCLSVICLLLALTMTDYVLRRKTA